MRERLARRAGEEDGVVLVLVALLMVVILASCALAIDVGSFYTSQRHAQSAADAAALAASQGYASGTTDATSIGNTITSFVQKNYPDENSINWTSSYGGTPGRIRVDVGGASPAFFGRALGMTSAKVSAYAVAGATGTYGPSAVFAMTTKCGDPGVTIGGNTFTSGNVHSNGSMTITGNGTSVSAATYGAPCTFSNSGNRSVTAIQDPNPEPWPYDYSKDGIPAVPACVTGPTAPVYNQPTFTFNSDIPQGTYCATGNITISGTGINASGSVFISTGGTITISGTQVNAGSSFYANGANGGITFSANNSQMNGILEATGSSGLITINGNSITGNATMYGNAFSLTKNSATLAPYPGKNGLMIYQTGTSTLSIDGNGFLDGGTIFAPQAPIVFNGEGSGTVSGFIEGQDVSIAASNSLTINGTGPNTDFGGTPGLVQ